MRNKGIVVLVALLALSACGYKHRPIYNVDDPMPRWNQSLPLERVEDLIVAACTTLNWRTQHVGPGHLVATQSREAFSATIDIFFDSQHWQIHYLSSTGLTDSDGNIHSHYNSWIHNLEHEIQLRFNSTMPLNAQ